MHRRCPGTSLAWPLWTTSRRPRSHDFHRGAHGSPGWKNRWPRGATPRTKNRGELFMENPTKDLPKTMVNGGLKVISGSMGWYCWPIDFMVFGQHGDISRNGYIPWTTMRDHMGSNGKLERRPMVRNFVYSEFLLPQPHPPPTYSHQKRQ